MDLRTELRYAARSLSKSPGFVTISVLMTALAVGATSTTFSLLRGVLLKPLPWSEPDRLVRLQETRGGNRGRVPWTITNTTYHAWREHPATIEEVGGWMRGQMMTLVVGSGDAERLRVGRVTPSLLRVLRARVSLGRLFSESDGQARPGAEVVILGFGLWQRRFGSDAAVVGQTLRLDDRLMTIIGVMPRDFAFPDHETQAWLPLEIPRVEANTDVIRAVIFNALARLGTGSSAEQASSEATARGRAAPNLGSAAVALFGSSGEVTVAAVRARDALTGDVRPALIVLLSAVGLLFSAAIASVLVVQSSRAAARRRQTAVRLAIGADARQVLRHWLIESAVIGVCGGAAGLLLAAGLHRVLPVVLPSDFPRVEDVRLDAVVAVFATGLTLLAIILCGLVPALQIRDRRLVDFLAGDGATADTAANSNPWRVRTVMMAAQVAVACVLLVATGVLARSFVALLAADRGFDPRDVLTAHLTLTKPRPFASQSAGLERAQRRLAALPGVQSAGFGNALPFVTTGGFRGFTIPSPKDPGATVQVQTLLRTVSPEYFPALGLRVLAGRPLDSTDTLTSRPVVVVNKTFAAQYLGADPVGTILPIAVGSRREWEIVGIIEDVRQGGLSGVAPAVFGGVADPPQPEIFFTYRQWTTSVGEIVYVVRGDGNSAPLASTLRTIVREEDPMLTVDSIMTMEDRVMHSLARPRTYAVLIGGFAVFAVSIAAVGLFGVISYVAARRTREIGIRTALGAQPRHILRLVTTEAVLILVVGLATGLGVAALGSRLLTPLLYAVSPFDIITFVGVPFVLATIVAAACAVPARRAARLSPLTALRHQ